MISIRSLLSLFAFLLLVGCAGTNAVTTDVTDEVVEIVVVLIYVGLNVVVVYYDFSQYVEYLT